MTASIGLCLPMQAALESVTSFRARTIALTFWWELPIPPLARSQALVCRRRAVWAQLPSWLLPMTPLTPQRGVSRCLIAPNEQLRSTAEAPYDIWSLQRAGLCEKGQKEEQEALLMGETLPYRPAWCAAQPPRHLS
jgi:hypothetical protein